MTAIKPLLTLGDHTGINSLCALLDGRLASGGDDANVCIWDLGAMLAFVFAFPDLIRVFATTSSTALEIEEALRTVCDLCGPMATVVALIFGSLRFVGSYPFVAANCRGFVVMTTLVSEAITRIISAGVHEETQNHLIVSMGNGLWSIVQDDEFVSLLGAELSESHVPAEIQQKLLASPLEWVILLAQHQSGPSFVFWTEFLAFCALALCHCHVAYCPLVAEDALKSEQHSYAAVVFVILLKGGGGGHRGR